VATRQQQRQLALEERQRREQAAAAEERRRKRYAYGIGGFLGAVLLAALVLLVVTSGGGDSGSEEVTAGGGAEAGHVHGLGVNPADDSLMIATHNGLYRAADGSAEAPRVGRSDRDLMGFSVVGPDHFVASGHPGGESNLPANIGLIESRDGGTTWEPVSLLGEADFHVLRASGQRVYGYDGVNARFMVSPNLGRDWQQRDVPDIPFDLAIDPGDPQHVVIATESGLQESSDAGRSWRPLSEQIALLAWADAERLFLLDSDGQVLLGRDGGRTARPQGRIQGDPVSFMATAEALYVALADGTVLQSADDGATFRVRASL
jgi:hypothetical protein